MDRSPLNFTPNNTNKNDKKERECFSSGKRSHREEARESSSMDVDDLVSMISSKLEHLDTSDSLESLIAVFMEVLKCSQKEAEFFLDSAGNDLATAVSLYLEEQSYLNRRRANTSSAPQHLPPTILEYDPSFRRYRQVSVKIAGLPTDWEASVCPITGVVLFEHLPTGVKQNQVPPGFADALPVPPGTNPFSMMTNFESSDGRKMSSPNSKSFSPFSSTIVEVDDLDKKQDLSFDDNDEHMEEEDDDKGDEDDDVFCDGL